MTRIPQMAPLATPAKPAPNVYTAMLVVAILAMTITIVLVMVNLTSESGYGLSAGEVFGGFSGVPGQTK